MAEAEKAYAYMRSHKYFKMWQARRSSLTVMGYASAAGIFPTHNFKDGTFARVGKINGETMLGGYKIGDTACFAFAHQPAGILNLVKQGKYVGTVTEGPEYESCAMLGSNLGDRQLRRRAARQPVVRRVGMDTISTGSLIGAVIEGYEAGRPFARRSRRPADFLGRRRPAVIALIKQKMARREGLGNVLADVAKGVIGRWPENAQVCPARQGL